MRAQCVGHLHNLAGIALDALPMKCRGSNAAAASVRLSVRGDEPLAEQDFHALLGAVFAEGSSLVDQHFADVAWIVEQHHVSKEDAVMCGAAVASQVFEQQNRIARLKEFMEQVERQIHAQAGRVEITAAAHQWRRIDVVGRGDG